MQNGSRLMKRGGRGSSGVRFGGVWRMVGVANGRVDSGALWMGGPGDGDLREIPSQLILRIDHRCILQEELENDLPY